MIALRRAGLIGVLLTAACAQGAVQPETVRVCKSGGCVDQSPDVVTYDPSTAVPDPDPQGLLPVLEPAAEQDPRAAFDLGLRYMRGDGLRQNSWEAIKWMRDAAERGDLRAQSALGRLYLTGLEETGADYNEAQRWLSIAAGRGDGEARTLLKEAEAKRAEEQTYQTWLWRWQTAYTRPYWYGTRYYGYWRRGYSSYYYY